MTPSIPSFNLTREALIESYGSKQYIYGRWDRIFGCWSTAGDGSSTPFVPRWPLINKFGELAIDIPKPRTFLDERDPSDIEDWANYFRHFDPVEYSTFLNYTFDSELVVDCSSEYAAFAEYIDFIPYKIRLVAGAFGSAQWTVLAMIHATPDFESFLRKELRSVGNGFISACLKLADAQAFDPRELSTFCKRLMHEKRIDLLASLTGQQLRTRAVNLLEKLEIDSWSTDALVQLFALSNDSDMARILGHMPKISSQAVWWLSRLPHWICSSKLIETLSECDESTRLHVAADFSDLIREVNTHYPNQRLSVASAFSKANDWLRVWELVNKQQLFLSCFPPPPFPGLGKLQPLTSAKMLRAEGFRMRNCIGDLAESCQNGQRYFYRWDAQEPATVELLKHGSGSWEVLQCLGLRNQPLTQETVQEIKACFASASGASKFLE